MKYVVSLKKKTPDGITSVEKNSLIAGIISGLKLGWKTEPRKRRSE
jgi:hypothetical protein